MLNTRDTKFKTVAHYLRMMYWVVYESDIQLTNIVNANNMINTINECWGGYDCPYCQIWRKACSICPLNYGGKCCNGHWILLNYVSTWQEWLLNTDKVLKYIIENG